MRTAILPLLVLFLTASRPDEGQWLPGQIRNMDWTELNRRGLKIGKDELWHPERGGLVNAAVQIGTCSAAFVSPEGLLLTNHHCVFAAISALSSLEQNYLEEGFHSRSRARELRTDLEVTVVTGTEDVTDRVHAAQARARDDLERWEFTQREIRRLCEEAERDPETGRPDPMTTCTVSSFFQGREYHLYRHTLIKDVRLAYAPPRRAARFGGDVDNWEWPRHSCDFALLRAYVAPDGTPRPFHRDNVPYRPRYHLQVSARGVQEGDLVLIVGYPRRTYRYLTSVALQDEEEYKVPLRLRVMTELLAVVEAASEESPERSLSLSGIRRSVANQKKKALGTLRGIIRNELVDRKLEEEEEFTRWVRRAEERRRKYGSVLQDLMELDHRRRATLEKDQVLGLIADRVCRELCPLLHTVVSTVREAEARDGNGKPAPEVAARIASPAVTERLHAVQKHVLEVLLEEIRNLPRGQHLVGSHALPDSDVTSDQMIEELLAATRMTDPEARLALLQGGRAAVEASTDPLVVLARGIVEEQRERRRRNAHFEGRRLVVGRRWIEAQQEWRGKDFYPDANRTLRISIAEVKGYSPRDGVYYWPHTTVEGVLDKNRDEEPFRVPDLLREAARRRGTSRFMNARIGDVPVCFLSDGDTTGGNSGSPVLNGHGELVGINFDRVFENVSSDFGWDPDRSRNISVDIRYVLWHLDSVVPAPRLLREMGL